MFLDALAPSAQAKDTSETLVWRPFENKDVFTKRVVHQLASAVTFADGSDLEAFVKCDDKGVGGVVFQFDTFRDGAANPFLYLPEDHEVMVPVVINDAPPREVHLPSKNPRSNQVPIGFYDHAAARRYVDGLAPRRTGGMLGQVQAWNDLQGAKNDMVWNNFVSGQGGSLADLLRATTVRVQLRLANGTANVAEINAQDAMLKDFVQGCASSSRK